MLKAVLFCDKATAERNAALSEWAVISLTDVGCKADLKNGWFDVLRLRFLDADIKDDCFAFADTHAIAIADFVASVNDRGVYGILVHCHAGISRSAAVAKWIAQHYDLPFNHQYQLHNKLVYETLCENGKNIA